MSDRITSVEVANIMLQRGYYMTIAEIISALNQAYPELVSEHTTVTNVVRTFLKSPAASCLSLPDAYPRQYLLTSVHGYLFKVRGGRKVCFEGLPFHSGSKQDIERENEKSRMVSRLAFGIFNDLCRRRCPSLSVSGRSA